MSDLRFKGFQTGTPVDVTVAIDIGSSSLIVPAFRTPDTVQTLPRINSGQAVGETLTLDTTGLTGITAYQWRVVGGEDLGTTATQDSMGLMGQWVDCTVTCDQGVLTTPAIMVYMAMAMASHNADDAAIVALCPHHEATHIAVADGTWGNPATWLDGRVPANGARVLIPHSRVVVYDHAVPHMRLDWVRVDGALNWPTTESTTLLVETVLVTRGGVVQIGTGRHDRVASAVTHDIIWSNRCYRNNSFTPTDLNRSYDPDLWGRGFVCQGTARVWGREKMPGCLTTGPLPAGTTSLTLEQDPVGWDVGDVMVVAGLGLSLVRHAPFDHEDEDVTITNISGRTVTFSPALVYDHTDRSGENRQDIRPAVQLKEGRNVTMRSESTSPVWRRGHAATVHGMSTTDLWGMQCLDMGRSDKSRPVGKKLGNDFQYPPRDDSGDLLTELFTARSNIRGRYAWHLHHVGFDHTGARPIVAECYFARTPGWALVHHACDADLLRNSVREFWSGGIIGEQGNELGAWTGNIVSYTTSFGDNTADAFGYMTVSPKGTAGLEGRAGDTFHSGALMGFRGRGVRTADNIMFNGYWAAVFEHRASEPAIDSVLSPRRERMDVTSIVEMRAPVTGDFDEITHPDYPIIHFNNNMMMGVYGGFFVTKLLALQNHDVSIILRNNTVWAARGRGCIIEYVGTYILDNWDVTCMRPDGVNSAAIPFETGNNAYQIAFRNCRGRGSRFPTGRGITLDGDSATGHRDVWDPDNPRHFLVGNDFESVQFNQVGTQTQAQVVYESDDLNNTRIVEDRQPTFSMTNPIGEWDGVSNSGTLVRAPANADGKKSTNFGNAGNLAAKNWADTPFADENGFCHQFCGEKGYYEHNGGWVLLQWDFIADELTGRPAMYGWTYDCSVEPSAIGANNGALVEVTTPIVQNDIEVTCAANGTVTVSPLVGATGGNGTIVLHDRDHISPDHGTLVFNGDGTVTYTPDYYVSEITDQFYLFLRSGDTMFETVRVNVIVGAGTAPETPVPDTHFTVTDSTTANAIDVTLTTPPAVYGRKIRLVQYSTDSGATWRRLTNFWPQMTHTITAGSDDTALSSGAYNVRLRYETDHEYAYAPDSADVAVTVS